MQSPFAAMRGPIAPVLVDQPAPVTLSSEEPRTLRIEVFYRALPKVGFRLLESKERKVTDITLKAGWSTKPEIKALEEKFISARVNDIRTEFTKAHPEHTVRFTGGEAERDSIQIIVATSYPLKEETHVAQ